MASIHRAVHALEQQCTLSRLLISRWESDENSSLCNSVEVCTANVVKSQLQRFPTFACSPGNRQAAEQLDCLKRRHRASALMHGQRSMLFLDFSNHKSAAVIFLHLISFVSINPLQGNGLLSCLVVALFEWYFGVDLGLVYPVQLFLSCFECLLQLKLYSGDRVVDNFLVLCFWEPSFVVLFSVFYTLVRCRLKCSSISPSVSI